mgnify:CR=1 FL=1
MFLAGGGYFCFCNSLLYGTHPVPRAEGTPYSERERHLIPSERGILFRAGEASYSERERHLIPSGRDILFRARETSYSEWEGHLIPSGRDILFRLDVFDCYFNSIYHNAVSSVIMGLTCVVKS